MKLICNVDVCNRLVPTLPIRNAKRKPQRSCLAIGRPTIKKDDFYLLLQTQTNKGGTKYKVNDNVEQIFAMFLEQGKATIRLKEPPHDLVIQSDPIQLKSFLHVLKLGLTKKLDPSILTLSNLSSKKLPPPSKTKFVIQNVSDYPTLQGFPRTTEELHIVGLERRSFDRQILKLQSLRILNLSENNLTSLPNELGSLPNLQELVVAQNKLGQGPPSKWNWLNGQSIKTKLKLLNISSNEMTFLPEQIKNLYSLVTLNLSHNLLCTIPQGIGNLRMLKFLILSKNRFKYLPGNMRNLNLNSLDLSDNPFDMEKNLHLECLIRVPRLTELAGQVILRIRKHYDASIIPYTLVTFLDKTKYCMCGLACFDCYIRKFINFNLSNISNSVISSCGSDIRFDCYFCSVKCVRKYVPRGYIN